MGHAVVAVTVFALVLALVLWQPRGLGVGWPPAVGAVLVVVLGVVPLSRVEDVVRLVGDATLAFVGIVLNSLVLDHVGFFDWAALHLLLRARGDGCRLFLGALGLGSLVAALFSNDGAALIFTPILYEQARALGWPRSARFALVMAGGFVADFTSTPLVTSNLVNIIAADDFRLGFDRYALHLVPVDVVTAAVTTAVLYAVFRRALPVRFDNPGRDPASAVRDPALFRWVWPVLALMVVGFVASEPLRIPVSLVVSAATVVLLYQARRSPVLSVRRVVREAPWHIVAFSIGLYVVVFGLRDAGLLATLTRIVATAARGPAGAGVLTVGGLTGGLAAGLNNLPAILMTVLAIHGAGLGASAARLLAYAAVVGADVGPKLTPVGSLATLLWLHVLERRGMRVGWGEYTRVAVVVTVPVLATALATVWAWSRLVG
ncbi:MAG: arsenical efflux pump membrane protein ArsB [Actinomycetia bacterium]|nr:arsenical efflux pump membrane protein ArsB [Actinomycetes bacterium]